jgi:hypothetical protein
LARATSHEIAAAFGGDDIAVRARGDLIGPTAPAEAMQFLAGLGVDAEGLRVLGGPAGVASLPGTDVREGVLEGSQLGVAERAPLTPVKDKHGRAGGQPLGQRYRAAQLIGKGEAGGSVPYRKARRGSRRLDFPYCGGDAAHDWDGNLRADLIELGLQAACC